MIGVCIMMSISAWIVVDSPNIIMFTGEIWMILVHYFHFSLLFFCDRVLHLPWVHPHRPSVGRMGRATTSPVVFEIGVDGVWFDFRRSIDLQLHMCLVRCSVHTSQWTSQHHLKVQWHLICAVYCSVLKPRPQHISWQPSISIDVALHSRPLVPEKETKNFMKGLPLHNIPLIHCDIMVANSSKNTEWTL